MKENNDYFQVLNTVNSWIFNCDTKVSIILATYGVMITALLSSDFSSVIVKIIEQCIKCHTVCNIIYLMIFVGALVIFGYGLYKLICVLLPKIDLTRKSIMFFGSVATFKSFEDYIKEANTYIGNDAKAQEDILFQIYVASNICSQKFKNQKKGLHLTLLASLVIIVWLLVGVLSFCM